MQMRQMRTREIKHESHAEVSNNITSHRIMSF